MDVDLRNPHAEVQGSFLNPHHGLVAAVRVLSQSQAFLPELIPVPKASIHTVTAGLTSLAKPSDAKTSGLLGNDELERPPGAKGKGQGSLGKIYP